MRVVVKVGTSTLAHKTGCLNIRLVETLCKTLADLQNAGHQIVLVSSGAIGMGVADLMDPIYITGAPKTFILKMCIGLIVGLVAHRIARINDSSDKKYVFKWSMIASVAGLGFNVVADPIVGYFYKMYILGQPQKMAEVLAKWSTAATFVNAVISTVLVACLYNALRPILLRSGMILTKSAGK